MSPYTDGIYTFRFTDDDVWHKICHQFPVDGETIPDLTSPFEDKNYKHLENQCVFLYLDNEDFLYYAKALVGVLLRCFALQIHVHMGDKLSLFVADQREQVLLDDLCIFDKDFTGNVIARTGF